MASFDYNATQDTAKRLIDRFGTRNPIVRVNSSYDAVTGQNVITDYYLTTASVVTLPSAKGVTAFDDRFREDVKRGKIRFFYVAAKDLSFKPQAGDKIFFEGDSWEIGGATPLNPAGVHIMSTIGCRLGDKNHLGETLKAIAEATEGAEVPPPDVNDPNVIQDILDRIDALENEDHLRFSTLPTLPDPTP